MATDTQSVVQDYPYRTAEPSWSNHYLWRPVQQILDELFPHGAKVFELGCGSGATAAMLAQRGFAVTAVDSSVSGIKLAQQAYPHVFFAERSAYEDLSAEFGQDFDAVVSLEVIEHCYWPRKVADSMLALLRPGGVAIISTPFHGYWKNLALALSNKLDAHFTALWDGGHVKFWSKKTLRALLEERGFRDVHFRSAGRLPPFAKSMIAVARRPT